jgi:hypothetical protein
LINRFNAKTRRRKDFLKGILPVKKSLRLRVKLNLSSGSTERRSSRAAHAAAKWRQNAAIILNLENKEKVERFSNALAVRDDRRSIRHPLNSSS